MKTETVPSSFRDPGGFLFYREETLLRQVNHRCRADYDQLMQSGLYEALVEDGLLVPHQEVDLAAAYSDDACRVLKPTLVPCISYPYEWSFSQLKDAALITLKIQQRALEFGMSLKDASAYNIQFFDGKAIFIDTLSFEPYRENQAWVAYRQFCQHFLAPLALMCYRDIRLGQLLRTNIDGIPLDLASTLLPLRTRFRFSLLTHLHLHARSQRRYANAAVDSSRTLKKVNVSLNGLKAIIDSLVSAIKSLQWKSGDTEWGDYYNATNYDSESMQHKKELVSAFMDQISPAPTLVQDLGANTGVFSRIAADKGMNVLSQDIDPKAVEINYQLTKRNREHNILPMLVDLTNPSPALGWAHSERMSLMQRGPVDVVMALALIHHLAISNHVPLPDLARFFSRMGQYLLIEFVPRTDSQVRRLLATREDVFEDYTQSHFENAFAHHFEQVQSQQIRGSERTLYLLRKR
jgi:ribosomal protein L11 methylase PrmA